MRGEHGVGLLGLLEEAALAAALALHHQVVVFGLHYCRLVQVILHVALIARVHVHPAWTHHTRKREGLTLNQTAV